jgi:acyl-CoA synthetase
MRPYLTLQEPTLGQSYYDAGLWQADTFYTILARRTSEAPDDAALRDGQHRLTWRMLKAQVDAMADDMRAHGMGAGDRLSIWMSNRVEAIVAFLACSREGVACNPSLHRSYTCEEIVTLLRELDSSALLTEAGWGADRGQHDLNAMLDQLPRRIKLYDAERMPRHITGYGNKPQGNPDSVAYLAFTSGTTGRPKCVMHSSNTLLANARDLVRDWRLDRGTVILTLSPLSHHIAWVAVSQWLLCGGTLVTDDVPPGVTRLDWIQETGATYVMGVPTHAMDILAEQRARGLDRLGAVKVFYMAGAPIPDVVARELVAQGIMPQNVYGMTECSSHQYTHPDDDKEVWVSTCGRGGPAYEVKIWDPENPDRELPQGATGEIGGRGACLMLGYFGNQQATEKAFNRQGYMLSGDLGSLDLRGNLRIEGRLKDLIIRGGHNIYPSHIEALAVTHPAIEKAAAFGIADERLGERVCLAIIGSLSADEVLEHLACAGLSKFDMPEWFVAMPTFPLTPSGKILKRELADMASTGRLIPQKVRYVEQKA